MKKMIAVEELVKFRLPIFILFVFTLVSCEPENNNFGSELFPPSDTIIVNTDTIYNFETKLVRSKPVFTSVNTSTPSSDRLFLLGAINDTITGLSRADIITQIAFSNFGNMGTNPVVDTLRLLLYVSEIEGDTVEEMRILVYDFTGEISYDNAYFSDYDIGDNYNPVPLVDEIIVPKPNTYYEFDITDTDYLERLKTAIADSLFADFDSIPGLQKILPGLYITTEVSPTSNSLAKVGLSNPISRLGFHYAHDSIGVDTLTADDFRWYYMNFNEFYAQKVNMFHHDYTGTALEDLIDDPDANPSALYVQGMAGVNVELSIPEFENYLDSGIISINSARLIFEVMPDTLSGISVENYPGNLMMAHETEDSLRVVVYDYLTNTSSINFGRLIRSNSVSAFLTPLYLYRFNLGLHFQSVLNGSIDNNKLILYVNNPITTSKFIKLWSNDSVNKGSLRLEIVYTKF